MSNNKSSARQKIRYRIRKKISGTPSKPRLSVFRSNSDIYAQLIDDTNGATIAAASSKQKDISAQKAPKIEKSKMVGEAIAKKATETQSEDGAALLAEDKALHNRYNELLAKISEKIQINRLKVFSVQTHGIVVQHIATRTK